MVDETGKKKSDLLAVVVIIDFFKYAMLIAAAFIVGMRIYYVSFLGALLFVDMFTRRFAVSIKPLYAFFALLGSIVFLMLT